ncbi:MAG: hypothetical protein AB1700_12940 [Bacillota bacterium]
MGPALRLRLCRETQTIAERLVEIACKILATTAATVSDALRMPVGSVKLQVQAIREESGPLQREAARSMQKLDLREQLKHLYQIYLGDPRRSAPEKLKTVMRLPIRRLG